MLKLILLEDDDIDAMRIERTLARRDEDFQFYRATDGVDGLALLRGSETVPAIEPPYAILLDLNMPRMGGLEFLQQLRADPALAASPVIVMTTSNDQRDVVDAHEFGITAYVNKASYHLSIEHLLDRLCDVMASPESE